MPESNIGNIEPVLQLINESRINKLKILDIGMGWGNFGYHIKENINKKYIYIEGIEIFEKYRNSRWRYYDKIIIGDILDIYPSLDKYDVILGLDVIEHLTKRQGFALMKSLMKKTGMLIVSLPIINYPQKAKYGNVHERHLAQWSVTEMLNQNFELIYFNKIIGVFVHFR